MSTDDDFDAAMALADERLDQGDYPAAREAYRRVALLRTPSAATLHNLREAENGTRFAFLRTLMDRDPDDVGLVRELAMSLAAVDRAKNGMTFCQDLLERHPGEAQRLQGVRFFLAVRGGGADHLAEDFAAIWARSEPGWGARRLLLEDLGRLPGGPDTLAALRSLATSFADQPPVSELITAKIAELEALARVLAGQAG